MKKIVLIEDDSDLYSLLQYNLEKEGFQMSGSKTGKGAIDLCRSFGPDLILLDIMLPRMDGYNICQVVRKNMAYREMPIIMLSGKDGLFDKMRGKLAGSTEYITKPFDSTELVQTVKRHLDLGAVRERAAQRAQRQQRLRRRV